MIEEAFYVQWGDGVPVGLHYEVEVLSKELTGHPLMAESPSPLHVHLSSKNDRYFICWTHPVDTFDLAMKMASAWAVGTVYTIESAIDFAKILYANNIEPSNFDGICDYFQNEHMIEIISFDYGD